MKYFIIAILTLIIFGCEDESTNSESKDQFSTGDYSGTYKYINGETSLSGEFLATFEKSKYYFYAISGAGLLAGAGKYTLKTDSIIVSDTLVWIGEVDGSKILHGTCKLDLNGSKVTIVKKSPDYSLSLLLTKK